MKITLLLKGHVLERTSLSLTPVSRCAKWANTSSPREVVPGLIEAVGTVDTPAAYMAENKAQPPS
jgi:hypothetical protein